MMKKAVWLVAFATICMYPAVVFASSATSTFDRDITANGIRTVSISNPNGDIELLTGSGSDISIHAVKKVTGEIDERCEQLVNDLEIQLQRSSIALDISLASFHHIGYEPSIEYTIILPASVDVRAETENGNIACRDRNGDLKFESEQGDIELSNCTGRLDVTTNSGHVTMESPVESGYLKTKNGDMDLYVSLASNGRLTAKSTNGSIKIHFPDDISSMVTARSSNGTVLTGPYEGVLAMNGRQSVASGKLGFGEGTIVVETVNGNVTFDVFHSQPEVSTPTVITQVIHERPVIHETYVDVFGSPCYPRFHHFWRPWRPIEIVIGNPFHGPRPPDWGRHHRDNRRDDHRRDRDDRDNRGGKGHHR